MVNNSHGFNWSKCSVKCNNSFGKSNAVGIKKGISVFVSTLNAMYVGVLRRKYFLSIPPRGL